MAILPASPFWTATRKCTNGRIRAPRTKSWVRRRLRRWAFPGQTSLVFNKGVREVRIIKTSSGCNRTPLPGQINLLRQTIENGRAKAVRQLTSTITLGTRFSSGFGMHPELFDERRRWHHPNVQSAQRQNGVTRHRNCNGRNVAATEHKERKADQL